MSFRRIVEKLIENNDTISTMESCTGGLVANEITNIEGASEVLKFSAVTYSNEFKIKMGVSSKTIDKYSVYSMETAHEMAKNISDFTNSSYGVGITGKLNKADSENNFGDDNVVYISIYNKMDKSYLDSIIQVCETSRQENKKIVLNEIENLLNKILVIDSVNVKTKV